MDKVSLFDSYWCQNETSFNMPGWSGKLRISSERKCGSPAEEISGTSAEDAICLI
jgi:hypothetical protein